MEAVPGSPDADRLGRRGYLALLATAGAGAGVVGRTLAAFGDSESDSGSLTSAAWSVCRAVYTDGGALGSVTEQGGVSTYGVSGVDVVGSAESGFDGSEYHIPVVDGNSDLRMVGAGGGQTTLDVGSSASPRGAKSILTTAIWNGNPLSIYYPGDSASQLLRVEPGETTEVIAEPSSGVKAALGVADLDGDGVDEFVFVDSSATVRYITPSTASTTRSIDSTGKSPGSNNNYGVGSPASIDGYGVVVPAVNGSGGLGLLGANGWVEKSLTGGSAAKKTPVHACDFDGDGRVELVFASYSNSALQYLDDIGGTNTVRTVYDAADDTIPVDTKRGVC